MTNSFLLPRKLIIFGSILPIAAIIGYQLANPDFGSFAILGLVAAILCIPLVLRWHHEFLFLSWNAAIQVFFLPGQPLLWMLATGISLGISVFARFLHKREMLTFEPSIVFPLFVLAAVVFVTAELTGGIGLRVLGGSSYGGKRYIYFFAAVVGYFALTAQRISLAKVKNYVAFFFLSSTSAALGHFVFWLGPSFWFLYAILPVGYAGYEAVAEFTGADIVRYAGFTFAGMGICQYVLCRFGVQGLLTAEKPWRMAIFVAALFLTLMGGFRSGLVTIGILFAILFFLEGLHRTRVAVPFAVATVLLAALAIPFASKLPLSVQRALAFLPIEVNAAARADAFASSQWRIQMWQLLVPEIPQYLFLGKGSTVNPTELYLMSEAQRRGQAEQFESSLVAGDYHSAPLTLIIQFGIWGVLAFLWFSAAAVRYLFVALRNSPPGLKRTNTFLLATYLTNLVCFFTILGSFADHFSIFTGILGFSVSLNGSLRAQAALQTAPAG